MSRSRPRPGHRGSVPEPRQARRRRQAMIDAELVSWLEGHAQGMETGFDVAVNEVLRAGMGKINEERMTTRQAETESALDRLLAMSAQGDSSRDAEAARLRADIARRGEEAARDEKNNRRFQIGMAVAMVVILGVLIRWPG